MSLLHRLRVALLAVLPLQAPAARTANCAAGCSAVRALPSHCGRGGVAHSFSWGSSEVIWNVFLDLTLTLRLTRSQTYDEQWSQLLRARQHATLWDRSS